MTPPRLFVRRFYQWFELCDAQWRSVGPRTADDLANQVELGIKNFSCDAEHGFCSHLCNSFSEFDFPPAWCLYVHPVNNNRSLNSEGAPVTFALSGFPHFEKWTNIAHTDLTAYQLNAGCLSFSLLVYSLELICCSSPFALLMLQWCR